MEEMESTRLKTFYELWDEKSLSKFPKLKLAGAALGQNVMRSGGKEKRLIDEYHGEHGTVRLRMARRNSKTPNEYPSYIFLETVSFYA